MLCLVDDPHRQDIACIGQLLDPRLDGTPQGGAAESGFQTQGDGQVAIQIQA
jgi:hypothetical protein